MVYISKDVTPVSSMKNSFAPMTIQEERHPADLVGEDDGWFTALESMRLS